MSWKGTIKKNKFQGPLPEYATVLSNDEDHPAWKKHQKKQDKIIKQILTKVKFMRNSLVSIADDIKVSPQNQEKLDNVLDKFADILDLIANLHQPLTTDAVPSTTTAQGKVTSLENRKFARHSVELDRQRAKKLREMSGKK